jgi:hypothetical protein
VRLGAGCSSHHLCAPRMRNFSHTLQPFYSSASEADLNLHISQTRLRKALLNPCAITMGGLFMVPFPLVPFVQVAILAAVPLLPVYWVVIIFRCGRKCLQSPRKSFKNAVQEAVFQILVSIAAPIGISVVIWAMFFYQIVVIGQMIQNSLTALIRKLMTMTLRPGVTWLIRTSISRYALFRQAREPNLVAYPPMWLDHTYQYTHLTRMREVRLLVL